MSLPNDANLCFLGTCVAQEAGKQVVALQEEANPVDKAWGADRPAAPSAKLRVHPMQVCVVCCVFSTELCRNAHAYVLPFML